MKLGTVISVCAKRDLPVWRRAAPLILANLPAHLYLVITPDDEVQEFRSATPLGFEVEPESGYIGDLKSRIAIKLEGGRSDRLGWLLQQFIKIAAARKDRFGSEVSLLWDGDTVPLRPLNFVQEGKVVFYTSRERHQPYFDLISKLTGLREFPRFSFIAQSFPFRQRWVDELCRALEASAGLPWQEAILSAIDPMEQSGFSEYELLGAHLWANHRDDISLNPARWLRGGVGAYGPLENLSYTELARIGKTYDFASFEHWQAPRSGFQMMRSQTKAALLRVAYRLRGRRFL